jgi:hypothetical protein
VRSGLQLALRDGLRSARFVVRHLASPPAVPAVAAAGPGAAAGWDEPVPGAPGGGLVRVLPGGRLLRPLARLADRVASRVGPRLRGPSLDLDALAGTPATVLLPPSVQLQRPPEAFAADLYRIASLQLGRLGRVNALISEQVLAEIQAALRAESEAVAPSGPQPIEPSLPAQGDGQAALERELQLACALVLAFDRLRPILRIERQEPDPGAPRHLARAPNLHVGLVAALALLPETSEEPQPETVGERLTRCDLLVDAAFERLEAALRGPEPKRALARAILPLWRALG